MPFAVAAIGSAVIGGIAASDAADTQADAANNATAANERMFERNVELNRPWREAGESALSQLTAGLGAGGTFSSGFTYDPASDPSTQFRLQQGLDAVNSNAATRGLMLSGGNLKALTRYGQDFASNEYQNSYNRWNNDLSNRFNRLASVAGLGQTATRDVSQMGTNLAAANGNLQLQAANASAAGTVGTANAVTGGLSSLGNWWQNRQTTPTTTGSQSWGTAGLDNFFSGNGTTGD